MAVSGLLRSEELLSLKFEDVSILKDDKGIEKIQVQIVRAKQTGPATATCFFIVSPLHVHTIKDYIGSFPAEVRFGHDFLLDGAFHVVVREFVVSRGNEYTAVDVETIRPAVAQVER